MDFKILKETIELYQKKHPYIFSFLILYLGSLLLYIAIFHIWFADYSKPMSLNEIGDFLAGVFAPIAFLFLYIGYKQNSESLQLQGRELQISNESFKKQCEELANSVEQQRQLVEAATEDLKFSKAQYLDNTFKELVKSQPFIHLTVEALKWVNNDLGASIQAQSDREFNKIYITFGYANSRTVAREVRFVVFQQGIPILDSSERIFLPDRKIKEHILPLDYPILFHYGNPYIVEVKFTYLDEIDQEQYQIFNVEIYQDVVRREQRVDILRGESSFKNSQPPQ